MLAIHLKKFHDIILRNKQEKRVVEENGHVKFLELRPVFSASDLTVNVRKAQPSWPEIMSPIDPTVLTERRFLLRRYLRRSGHSLLVLRHRRFASVESSRRRRRLQSHGLRSFL